MSIKVIAMSVCILGTTFGVVACGQKGALYLPDSTTVEKTAEIKTKANINMNQTQTKQTLDKNHSVNGIPESEYY